MTFYHDDKMKAARLLFDAITDLEAAMVDMAGVADSALFVGLSLGKVCAAREYLAATLNMPVVAPDETAETKLRGHASLACDTKLREFMVRQGFDPNSALDVETARSAFAIKAGVHDMAGAAE